MPLDGHSYLVSQGWTGSGTGLRQGAISRPLAIPQKKNLAGLGKERDEAFPFWDHLFSAASKSIQIKISSDDEDSDAEPNASVSLKRTSTGILSNRRPAIGAPADNSGSTTPEVGDPTDATPRLSLLATAKREAAKRGLYSRFFRGPVLGPDSPLESEPVIVVVQNVALLDEQADASDEGPSHKKRKVSDGERDEKRERKRLRREKKELDKAERKSREKIQGKEKEKDPVDSDRTAKREKKRKQKQEPDADSNVADVNEGKREEKHQRKRKVDAEKERDDSEKKRKRKEEKRKSAVADLTGGEPKQKRKRLVE
ncbi:hypothetical protein DFH09DRAFT_518284 [Mycena vulgaris]|nr:hypothetical protein DFH09DRAFT_518284 [Mycena vulgaris]